MKTFIPSVVYHKLKTLEAENIGLRKDVNVWQGMYRTCQQHLENAWLQQAVAASTGMST